MPTNVQRLGPVVPWVALAAVTAFALVLLADRGATPSAATPREAPAASAPAPAETPGAVDPVAAANIAEENLDEALVANEALKVQVAELEKARDASLRRAEKAEARIATEEERLAAYEATLDQAGTLAAETQDRLDEMTRRVEELEARRKAAEDRVMRWIRDVASEEKDLRQRALDGVGGAGPDDLSRLAELVAEDPSRAPAVADLLAAVEPSDASDAVALAVLRAGVEPKDVPAALLVRPAVVKGALTEGDETLARGVLAALATHAARLDEEGAGAVSEAVVPLLDEPVLAPLAARVVGIARSGGAASKLAGLLASEDPAARAAAAYALSRVPDLGSVASDARKALPGLLMDDDLSVRTAGVLLAEAVLGGPVTYDPAADAAARGKAVDQLKQRL